VVSIFISAPDGSIIYHYGNVPGSRHDSYLLKNSGLLPVLRHFSTKGFNILADSGFPRGNGIWRVKKSNEVRIFNPETESQITKARVSAESLNNILASSWRRLQTDLPVNPEKRHLIFTCATQLHNFRTRLLGLNQIKSFYYENNDVFE
jgi:hypothetical protein